MGYANVVQVSNKLSDRMKGRDKVVQIQRAKNPFQKKQWVKAVATVKAATFTEKAVVETELFFLPFTEVIQKAQARWPGIEISYQTLSVTAAQKPKEEASPKKAE